MARSLGTQLAWFGYQAQQFQNFAIPPTCLSYPTAPKHCYHPTFFFWGGGGGGGRNYMSIIITIVSNITVLVSHIIFFGFFMPTSHGVNKKTPSSAYPTSISPYQVFIRFVCFTRNTLSTFFCCDQVICER